MRQPALVEFLDSRLGKCSATVGAIEEGVALALRLGERPEVAVGLPGPAAVQLARAILAAAGESAALPQSRQIGGIIGPY
jgi:hypothetical protein